MWSAEIEKLFKTHQDIEWIVQGEKIYFLQSRDIGAHKGKRTI